MLDEIEGSRSLLATIVHISDLHFGEIESSTGDSDLSAGVPKWWRYHSLFDGYLGHHANALLHLDDIYNSLKQEEDAILVVTGDLTATGARTQFDNAKNFLENSIIAGPHGSTGLQDNNIFSERTIPGNHDHWPGNKWIVGPPAALHSFFPNTPNSLPPIPIQPIRIPLSNGKILILCGIDTSAEVKPFSKNRFYARGSFVDQLNKLQTAIAGPRPNEIRVLLMHHSPQIQGNNLNIISSSRNVLEQTIEQFYISVLLTGHAHSSLGKVESYYNRGKIWNVFEARCGTTLQRDELPPSFTAPRFMRVVNNRFAVNSFLVHRIYEINGQTTWETKEYRRRNTGFYDSGLIQDQNGDRIDAVRLL